MSSGSLIINSSKYQIEHALKWPFKYAIQLFTGSRREHTVVQIRDLILECNRFGIFLIPVKNWLASRLKETQVYSYSLINELTPEEEEAAINYVKNLQERVSLGKTKYSIIENILFWLPILKKIKFDPDKYMFCDKMSLRIYQVIGRIGEDVYCAGFTPDQLPDLLTENYKLIKGKEIIKQ